MEIICSICGKKTPITPLDENYEKLKKGEKVTYICEQCSSMLSSHAKKVQKS
ncbi:MAG: DUF2197 domain-containing protein [Clostridia bacterium]|jgi:uncharacterized protein YlaI|nr:DUF2197 domain-containing protein [Clostridia bacterium]MDD4570899.1 DUF2197 domain-containing protein [Clostridia bacterium]